MFAAFPIAFDYTVAILVVLMAVVFLVYDVYQTWRRRE